MVVSSNNRSPEVSDTLGNIQLEASSLIQLAREAACCIAPLNTRLFLSLQTVHQTSTTIELKPPREPFAIFFLDDVHQSTMWSSGSGHSACRPGQASIRHQTTLVKLQPRRRWSIDSSTWEQRAQEPSSLIWWRRSLSRYSVIAGLLDGESRCLSLLGRPQLAIGVCVTQTDY